MSILNKLTEIFNTKSTDELGHLTTAMDKSVQDTHDNLNSLDVEYDISTSTGKWLEEWGSWFGIRRQQGETDESYRQRILYRVTTKKHSTENAYKETVRRVLGEDTEVTVYETYKDVRTFNRSTFSGRHRFQDSEKYRLGVIIIYLNKSVTGELVTEIFKMKASGIKVFFKVTEYTTNANFTYKEE